MSAFAIWQSSEPSLQGPLELTCSEKVLHNCSEPYFLLNHVFELVNSPRRYQSSILENMVEQYMDFLVPCARARLKTRVNRLTEDTSRGHKCR